MINVTAILAIWQCMMLLFYRSSFKLIDYINKTVFTFLFVLFIFSGEKLRILSMSDVSFLIPALGSSLLLLVSYTSSKKVGFSFFSKYFPTLFILLFLISNYLDQTFLTFCLFIGVLFDLISGLLKKESWQSKRYLTPLFIILILVFCELTGLPITSKSIFLILWIVVFKLFPFAIIKNDSFTINENFLSRIILCGFICIGEISFTSFELIVLMGLSFLTFFNVLFNGKQLSTLQSLNSVISTTLLVMYSYSGHVFPKETGYAILWVQFYIQALLLQYGENSLPKHYSNHFIRNILFLTLTGCFIGDVSHLIGMSFKNYQIVGELPQILIFILMISLSTVIFFSRGNYTHKIIDQLRQIHHFDTFISQLVIILGVILSI